MLALVASTADDEPVNTFAGQITLSEYLATRVVELGVHTLDLQRATGQLTELHPDTVRRGAVRAHPPRLTDRRSSWRSPVGRELPAGYNVLG